MTIAGRGYRREETFRPITPATIMRMKRNANTANMVARFLRMLDINGMTVTLS